jgi:hypothetical protein
MPSPIVHFQIASPNPDRMREFLHEVFGWEISQGALADIPYGIDTGWANDIVEGLHSGRALRGKVRQSSSVWMTSMPLSQGHRPVCYHPRLARGCMTAGTSRSSPIPEGQSFGIVQM